MDYTKTKKLNILLISLTLIAFIFSAVIFGINNRTAYAGKSRVEIVSDASFDEEISRNKWFINGKVRHESDPQTEKGIIVFDSASAASARIISLERADELFSGETLNECLNGVVSLQISRLNGEFYIVFGLEYAFSALGTGNCSAISFYNQNDKIAVSVINIEGKNADNQLNKTVVRDIGTTFDYNETITVSLNIKTVAGASSANSGKIGLDVNGTNYLNYDNDTLCYSEGYFGFAQSAVSEVKITSANVYSASYDSPTTINVDENFDNNEFDAARLFTNNNDSASAGFYTPEGVSCEDGVLKFNNITQFGFMSTCSQFSNFEMTFDVPHLQRKFEYDDYGNVKVSASGFFGIAIGAPLKDNSHYAITQSVFMYSAATGYVDGNPKAMSVMLLENFKTVNSASITVNNDADNNFWSLQNAYDIYGKEKTMNMKVSMIDGVLNWSFKWAGEQDNKYRTIIQYDLGYTPLGYVQIHGQGANSLDVVRNDSLSCSNFWLDNIKVVNRDENPNIEEPEYLSSRIATDEDYDYIDTWNYRRKTIEAIEDDGNSGCGSDVSADGTLIIGMVLLTAFAAVIARRRKNEK
ncbi:MAG: hypothetical protein IJQ66_04040 [Clostridia bacterium]|nr:hypothetical protein [Clostridia bacterium]